MAKVSLLDFEHEDVCDDFRCSLSDAVEWLATPNIIFAGKSPHQLIDSGETYRLRQVFRSVVCSSMA